MALRNIVKKGDDVLLKNCREVKDFNPRLHKLIDDMRETLLDSGGVGLAAPQVGVLRRVVLVLDTKVEPNEIIELVNPEIIETEGEQEGPEGCLSVPGVWGIVKRPMRVKVRAQNRFGEFFEVEGEELTARAFCHEIDHLSGILFETHASRFLTQEEMEELYADNEED
jgi:peptide deformylase